MKKASVILLIICALLCDNLYAVDLDILNFGKDAPVTLSADSIEYLKEENRYIVSGNAVIVSSGSELKADEIDVDLMNGKAKAKGGILLTTPDGALTATELEVNLSTKYGIIVGGRIFIKSENFYVTGESFERFDRNNYRVTNGTFTTCDGDKPSWKFSASSIDVEIDGYAYATNPVFYINNVPVLYLPAVVFPIKKTRQSGFLFPSLGYTTEDGALIKLPYYYVISESMDSTVALNYKSERGIGADTEFRYVLSETSRGEATYNFMNEFGKDMSRWKYTYRHTEYFSPTLSLRTDLTDVSDVDYFSDFGENAGEKNRERIESNIVLTKNFNNADIALEYSYDEDLIYDDTAGDLSSSNQQFPKVTGNIYKTEILGSQLHFSGASEFNNYIQKSDEEFSYLKLEPKLSADFVLGRYATLTPEITGRKARFWLHDDDARAYDNYDSYSAGITASTQLTRIFAPSGSLMIKHLLNPQISYEYIPKHEIYEDYYALAGIPEEKNEVAISIRNRFSAKSKVGDDFKYSEPFSLDITQSFDVYEAKRDIAGDDKTEKRKPIKPLFIETDINLDDYLSFSADIYYDYYFIDHLRQYNGTMSIHSQNTNSGRKNSLNLSYNYLKNSGEYLQGDANLIISGELSINSTIRYDYFTNTLLEETYGADISMQCWGVSLKYTDDGIEKKVLFFISMKGIGETDEITFTAE